MLGHLDVISRDVDETEKVYLLDSSFHDLDDEECQAKVATNYITRRKTGKGLTLAGLLAVIGMVAIVFGHLRPATQRIASQCSQNDFACHISQAQQKLDQILQHQSSTLEEARINYGKRYGRSPPNGFDEWYQFAVENNVTLIDEYDGIERDLELFRLMSKEQFDDIFVKAKKANEATLMHPYYLQQLNISRNSLSITQTANASDFDNDSGAAKLIKPILSRLGNISLSILLNKFDEPRVLPRSNNNGTIQVEDLSQKNTWDRVRSSCPNKDEPASRWANDNVIDICSLEKPPSHGFFSAPDIFRPFNSHVPLMSNAKLSNMGDTLVPPSAYFQDMYRHVEIKDEIPFGNKSKQIFWRGSTTGVFMHKHKWLAGYRQRFVFLAEMISDKVRWIKWHILQKTSISNKEKTIEKEKRDEKLSTDDFIDAAFTSVLHCEDVTCDDLRHHVPITKDSTTSKELLKYQILADLDGEGMSGRFYFLLASNSAVLKQTIYRE